jgi:RimJ/RimL family protein N-acetyltransferase
MQLLIGNLCVKSQPIRSGAKDKLPLKVFQKGEKMDPIEGSFVRLRPLNDDDADRTFKWRNLERAKFLGGVPESLDAQKSWIKSRPNNEINFIIELKHNSMAIGMLSLIEIDNKNRHAQSARFLIGEEQETSGIPVAAEAMLLLYKFAFETLELNRIYGFIAATNIQMIKWQQFFGMKIEGTWREHLLIDGSLTDAVLMGMLHREFKPYGEKRLNSIIKMGSR